MISVVVPILNEEDNLPELRRRIVAQLEQRGDPWELIVVDDGSSDASSRMLARMNEEDSRIKVVVLSRRFGHQQAITAGLHHVSGACAILLDGDLQDPPELIPTLLDKWREGFQVVLGERRTRAESGARGAGLRLFYPVLRWLSDLPPMRDAGIFGLMDRVVVDALIKLPERNRYLPGLRSWLGFRQCSVFYDRQPRTTGRPKQTWSNLVRYAADAMVSFSYKPLRVATYLGFLVSIFSFGLIVFYVVTFFTLHKAITGFTTTIACLLFLGGVQLICVGILGEYVGRIYDEVKGRPLYVVNRRLGFEPLSDTDAKVS